MDVKTQILNTCWVLSFRGNNNECIVLTPYKGQLYLSSSSSLFCDPDLVLFQVERYPVSSNLLIDRAQEVKDTTSSPRATASCWQWLPWVNHYPRCHGSPISQYVIGNPLAMVVPTAKVQWKPVYTRCHGSPVREGAMQIPLKCHLRLQGVIGAHCSLPKSIRTPLHKVSWKPHYPKFHRSPTNQVPKGAPLYKVPWESHYSRCHKSAITQGAMRVSSQYHVMNSKQLKSS